MRRFSSFLLTFLVVSIVFFIASKLGWAEHLSKAASVLRYLSFFFLMGYLVITLLIQEKNIFNKGNRLVRQRCYDQAILEFEKDIEMNPRKKNAFFGIGYCYFMMGYNRNSIRYFENALEIDPRQVVVHFSLAILYAEENIFAKAFDYLEKGKALQKRVSIFRKFSKTIMIENEGWVNYLNGDKEKALKLYKKVIPWMNRILHSWNTKRIEWYSPYFFRMGVIFGLMGKTEKAIKSFNCSVLVSSSSIFAQRSREELEKIV